jgi:predicted transcriptional regulator of viral defense system
MALSYRDKTLQLVKKAGILRPRDLQQHGIPRQYLHILELAGEVQRTGRGLYVLANAEFTETHSLAEACKRVPKGVVCLLSALRLHELTTQLPHEVWLAMDEKARKPKVSQPLLRVVRFSGPSLTFGIQQRKIEGVQVRFYDPAKTVADCFKYRNKIGLDVAIESLRDCWRKKMATMHQLYQAAKVCRVAAVMQPYMESLT